MRMDELLRAIQQKCHEERSGLCAKEIDTMGNVQIQAFSRASTKSRKVVRPDKEERTQDICRLGSLIGNINCEW